MGGGRDGPPSTPNAPLDVGYRDPSGLTGDCVGGGGGGGFVVVKDSFGGAVVVRPSARRPGGGAGIRPCVRRGRSSGGGGRESHWQDHWQQCLFVFGDGHSPAAVLSRMLTRGVPVTMIASHDDTSISFSIDTGCRQRVSRK